MNSNMPMDYLHQSMYLLTIGQTFCKERQDITSRLCQEVRYCTQERIQLQLWSKKSSLSTYISSNTSISVPVQYERTIYGSLVVISDLKSEALPVLSLPAIQLLANICGWILYTVELSLVVYGQPDVMLEQQLKPLTNRQQDVLTLLCRNYDQKKIAALLSIAPATVEKHRQQIYIKLGVHNEHEVLPRAYQMGLFSPLLDGEK